MSVINDLSTDQRVHKHCTLLNELGYDVLLIGRSLYSSAPLEKRQYKMHRMSLPFERGPLFYASYNLALLFNLLFRKADLLFSNDLDTLLPNFLVSRVKKNNLVYDSHEYFTEVPELVGRPRIQTIWKRLENWLLPRVKHALTVNQSIATLYQYQYGISMRVLRNVPMLPDSLNRKSKKELNLPENKRLIILQGSGINMDRGAEEAVQAMQFVENAVLLILGSGDVIDTLKQMVQDLKISDKVIFKGRMPYNQMMAHTLMADLGLTLDKDTNINYRFSLPNKLFDYVHAGVPVLASNLKEVRAIVESYEIGDIVNEVSPQVIADKISEMLCSDNQAVWKTNCSKAATELNWRSESKVLQDLLNQLDG